jgi:hypothetical protein
MDYLQDDEGGSWSEEDACTQVSERYPYTCGPFCHAGKCDGRSPAFCGCRTCTLSALFATAGGFTCAARIQFLQSLNGGNYTDEAACIQVADEFDACAAAICDPRKCDDIEDPFLADNSTESMDADGTNSTEDSGIDNPSVEDLANQDGGSQDTATEAPTTMASSGMRRAPSFWRILGLAVLSFMCYRQ